MFFYLAKTAASAAAQTAAFFQKGISGLTQAKISELPHLARADQFQIAYDGYKANIDVFLYATAMRSKVYTTVDRAPFPAFFVPSFPLPTPSIFFQFKVEPNPASKAKMMERYARYHIMEHLRGKTLIYTMVSPDYAIVVDKLLPLIKDSTYALDGYVSIPTYLAAMTMYKVTEAFLATNSYPFSRTLDGLIPEDNEGVNTMQFHTNLKRNEMIGRQSAPLPKRVSGKATTPSAEEAMQVDDEGQREEYDIPLFTEVMTAKPSPVPSSANYGAPMDVPFLPGLAFPYFSGMIAGDINATRAIMVSLFARNLCIGHETTKEGIHRFRKDIVNFLFTDLGCIMQHVLKGMEFALTSQTQLFLVFDKNHYLGFCLLGGCWSFYTGSSWAVPVSATELKSTLTTWTTNDSSLSSIAAILTQRPPLNGREPIVTADMIDTSMKLAKVIGKSDLSTEAGKEAEKLIIEHSRYLTHSTKFKGFGIETLRWALEQMTTKLAEDLPDDLNVYIPRSELYKLSRKEMLVFSAFGPLAPNIRSASGQEYLVPSKDQPDHFLDMVSEKVAKNPVVVVSMGPPNKCLESWDVAVKTKKIRFEANERASGSRCHVFKEKKKEEVWRMYKDTIGTLPDRVPVDKKALPVHTAIGLGVGTVSVDDVEW